MIYRCPSLPQKSFMLHNAIDEHIAKWYLEIIFCACVAELRHFFPLPGVIVCNFVLSRHATLRSSFETSVERRRRKDNDFGTIWKNDWGMTAISCSYKGHFKTLTSVCINLVDFECSSSDDNNREVQSWLPLPLPFPDF